MNVIQHDNTIIVILDKKEANEIRYDIGKNPSDNFYTEELWTQLANTLGDKED